MPPLTVTVITKNEAENLAAALASVTFADELIVIDSESTDDTVAIARRFTDRVEVRAWPGYVAQKNYAASRASHDWILSIDADERVTPELSASIRASLQQQPAHDAFRMKRITWHLGRWIRSTDWYPDYQTRLYNRRSAEWTGKYVHEALTPRVPEPGLKTGPTYGSVGDLAGELQHYPYRDVSDHLATIDRYTTLAARQMHEDGRRAGVLQLAGHPPLAFLRNYIAKGGIMDGAAGLTISALNAYYVFLKFAKLRELQSGTSAQHVERRT